MKKLILILALITSVCHAQCGGAYSFGVQKVSPKDTLKQGDSAFVYMAYNYGLQGSTVIHIYFTNNLYPVYSNTLQYLDGMRHATINGQDCAIIPFLVPFNCPVGLQYLMACGTNIQGTFITSNVGVEQYQDKANDGYFYFDYGVYKIKVNKRTKEKVLISASN